jgi:hypothetical protein
MCRYLQFRLRTALVLMAALAAPCAWVGANVRQWQAERRALAAIGPAQVTQARVEAVGQPWLAIFL